MSLEELASLSKLDKATLSCLEAGKQTNPTVATLLSNARALDMPLTLSLGPQTTATQEISQAPQANPTPGQATLTLPQDSGVELALTGHGRPYITARSEVYKRFRAYLDAQGITVSTRKGDAMGTVVIVPDPVIDCDRLHELVDRWTTTAAVSQCSILAHLRGREVRARMIHGHLNDVLTYFDHRITKAGANEGGQQDWCERNRKTGKLTPPVGQG